MESVTCLSSCSVVLRYLVSGAGAIHGEFPLRRILPCLVIIWHHLGICSHLLTHHIRSHIYFFSFGFKYTTCLSVNHQEIICFKITFQQSFPNGYSIHCRLILVTIDNCPACFGKQSIYFNSCFFFWCHRFKFLSSDNTILSEVLVFCSISFLKSSKTFPL